MNNPWNGLVEMELRFGGMIATDERSNIFKQLHGEYMVQ